MRRRLRNPEPPGEDMRRWRALVTAAAKPDAVSAIAKARRRCRERVLPADQQFVGSPLYQLARLTDLWPRFSDAQRAAQRGELLALAERCGAVVSPTPAHAVRIRADIDG